MGTTYNCVAPGEVAGNRLPHCAYLHVASKEDIIYFPHVDSCTALIFILADGRIVGGHVPWQWGAGATVDYGLNANRMAREMEAAIVPDSVVETFISVGDREAHDAVSGSVSAKAKVFWENHDSRGGLDVKVDGPRQRLKAYASPTKQKLCSQKFSELKLTTIQWAVPPLWLLGANVQVCFNNHDQKAVEQAFDKSIELTLRDKTYKGIVEATQFCTEIHNAFGGCVGFDAPLSSGNSGTAKFYFHNICHMEAKFHTDGFHKLTKFHYKWKAPI
jgi:hypothetical protein